MNEKDYCCGTCKYHMTNEAGEWVCDNHDGEYFGAETWYDDTCPDWEERNKKYDR